MQVTTTIDRITDAKKCAEFLSLNVLASPLLNIDHSHRVTLFKEKRECGTTMPLVLYAGLKARFIHEQKLDSDNEDVDKTLHQILRHLLSDIQVYAKRAGLEKDAAIGRTFQEKVFMYVVFNDPLTISGSEELLIKHEKYNQVHTVTGTKHPSCSVQPYICRWVLRKANQNVASPFRDTSSFIRRVCNEIQDELGDRPEELWSKGGGFSRRVQNILLLRALEFGLPPEVMGTPILNPEFKKSGK